MPMSSPTTPLYPPLTLTPQVPHANQTHSKSRRLNTHPKTSSVSTSQQEISPRSRHERNRPQRSLLRWFRPHRLQVCREQLNQLYFYRRKLDQCKSLESQSDKCKPGTRHSCRCRYGSLHTRRMQSGRRTDTSKHLATSAVQLQGHRKCG